MENNTPSINLLPRKGESFAARFLEWSLTIGRLLIILTETLALGTFLYRFSIDMQIVDLHDDIKIKRAIVKNFSNSEITFRNLQDKLALSHEYSDRAMTATNLFRDIAEMGRGKITFRSLLVSLDKVKIESESHSTTPLTLFINQLKEHPDIESVAIEKVQNSPSTSLITVSLVATLKNAQKMEAEQKASEKAEE